MAHQISTSDLKIILNQILSNSYDEMELIKTFKEIIDNDSVMDMECNFILMVILAILKEITIQSPVLLMFCKQLELELIFSCYKNEGDCCKPASASQTCTTPQTTTRMSDNGFSKEEIEKIFWEKYTKNPFNPGPNGRYQLPKEGETIDLGVKDNEVFTDLYMMRFRVDSKGNNLGWVEKPYKIIKPANFEEIYSGLVGQIMEYQKMN